MLSGELLSSIAESRPSDNRHSRNEDANDDGNGTTVIELDTRRMSRASPIIFEGNGHMFNPQL